MVVICPTQKEGEGFVGGKVSLTRVQKTSITPNNSRNRRRRTIIHEDCITPNPVMDKQDKYVSPQIIDDLNFYDY